MRVFGPTNTRSTTGAPSPVISSLVAANSAGTPLFSGAGDRNGANPVSIFRPGNPSGSSPSFPKLFLRRTPLQAEAKHNAVLEVASRRLSGWMDDSLIMYGDTYRFATVRTLVSGMKTFHPDRRFTELSKHAFVVHENEIATDADKTPTLWTSHLNMSLEEPPAPRRFYWFFSEGKQPLIMSYVHHVEPEYADEVTSGELQEAARLASIAFFKYQLGLSLNRIRTDETIPLALVRYLSSNVLWLEAELSYAGAQSEVDFDSWWNAILPKLTT